MYPDWTVLVIAIALDLLVGDPHWAPRPIRWIGRLIQCQDRYFLRVVPPRLERLAGLVTVMVTLGLCIGTTLVLFHLVGETLRFFLSCYLIFSLLALAGLDRETLRVIRALEAGDLELARADLARIVGRDTDNLKETEVVRAVTETVAENLNDAVVAPVFYLLLAGVPGMVAYKTINTLDSMIGYANERYQSFGWSAARLDDLVNYLPARLTALLVLCAAPLLHLDFRSGWEVMCRDAGRQPSPNAGYPEAAMAGVLGIRLGGPATYAGQSSAKALMGEVGRQPSPGGHPKVRQILYLSSGLYYALATLILFYVNAHA